jgi:hypothetical protein
MNIAHLFPLVQEIDSHLVKAEYNLHYSRKRSFLYSLYQTVESKHPNIAGLTRCSNCLPDNKSFAVLYSKSDANTSGADRLW